MWELVCLFFRDYYIFNSYINEKDEKGGQDNEFQYIVQYWYDIDVNY